MEIFRTTDLDSGASENIEQMVIKRHFSPWARSVGSRTSFYFHDIEGLAKCSESSSFHAEVPNFHDVCVLYGFLRGGICLKAKILFHFDIAYVSSSL